MIQFICNTVQFIPDFVFDDVGRGVLFEQLGPSARPRSGLFKWSWCARRALLRVLAV